mgnify:FL=1
MKKKKKQGEFRRFVGYYKPYLGIFSADMFFAFLEAGVALAIPLIIRYITSTVVYWDHAEAFAEIIKLACVLVGLVIVEAGSTYFVTSIGHIMGCRMETDLRTEIFGHYQKLSFNFFDNEKVGQLMSRVTNDLFEVTELFHHGPENIIISVVKFIGSFLILAGINLKLALAAFSVTPFMLVFALVYNRKLNRAYKKNRARIADINAQIEDSLAGVRAVRSFGNEEVEMDKFDEGNQAFLESKKSSYFCMATYQSMMKFFTTLITVVVLVTGAFLLTSGELEIVDLVTFLLYINTFTDPIKVLITFTEQLQNGLSGFERFLEILDIEPDIVDAPNAVDAGTLQGNIEFQDVSFRYQNTEEDVLAHINLQVKEGEYIALVGSSGAGKSTLCSLIPRFYDVTGGAVRIDGKDIREMTIKSLRRNIGVVQQDVYLFFGTVMDNIRYGKPDATEEEVIAAAKQANAHDFIMSLPEGYNTDIGQRGVKLSGGQKQRLSIARVFLKNPSILIFDEATSALDNESERIVQESLEKLAKNRTTFVIAHRLSTIHNAEKILVLTENGIEEQGTHTELLQKDGIYAHLYNMQWT